MSLLENIFILEYIKKLTRNMATPFIFETITKNQITNPFIHLLLIIIDTLPLIFIHIQIPSKFKRLNVPFFNKAHFLFDYYSLIVMLSVISSLIIIYNSFWFFVTRKNKNKCIPSIISTIIRAILLFNDLILFRYGSSFIIEIYTEILLRCIMDHLSPILLSFTCLSLLSYISTTCYHIQTIFIIIHIENKEIVKANILYPFDEFSQKCDLYIFFIKILGGLEYITYIYYNIKNNDCVNNNATLNTNKCANDNEIVCLFSCFFNYWCIILICYQFAHFVIYRIFIKGATDVFLINTRLNICRIGIIFFDFYSLIIMLLFINTSFPLSLSSLAIILSLTLVWSIASLLFIWNKVIIPKLFNGEVTIRKFVFIITRMFALNSSHSLSTSPFSSSLSLTFKQMRTSLFINPNRLYNSFKTYHFLNCTNDLHCNICGLYHSNSDTFSFIKIFKLLLKQKKITQDNEIDCVLSSMMLLLYFRFHNKIYKFYRQYHKLLFKLKNTAYHQVFINYINLLFASFTNINNDNNNISLYLHITTLSSLNSQIQSVLSSIKEFVLIEEEYNQYAQITQLASDLTNLHSNAQMILLDAEETKGEVIDSNEQLTKKIKNVYLYDTIISKFIIEKILNKPLNSLSPIEPDQLTDYFSSHYSNDSFLILGVQNSFLTKESISTITILKSGHSLIEYEGRHFGKIIPHKLFTQANEIFLSLLRHYNIETQLRNTFEFIINDNDNDYTVSSFKYKFDLLHALCNDTLLIYGFYSHPEKNIMLFEQNTSDSNLLILWRYSKSIQSLLLLPIKIIDKAKELQFYFTFKNLFTSIKKSCDSSCTNNDNTNNGKVDFECIFDLDHYSNLLELLLESFELFASLETECFIEEIANVIVKIRAKSLKQIKLVFRNISTIHCNHNSPNNNSTSSTYSSIIQVYSIKLLSTNHHTNITASDLGDSINRSSCELSKENPAMIHMTKEICSSSSIADNYSMTTISSHIKTSKKSNMALLTLYSSQEDTQKKNNKFKNGLAWIMRTIISCNVIIIILCIAFLVIQIKQLQSLYSINHLYFQFKQLRIVFTHLFLTIFSNICIGKKNTDTCFNAYIDYSQQFLNASAYTNNTINSNNGIEKEMDFHLIYSLIFLELKYKATILINQFNDNKIEFYQYNHKEIIGILNQKMNYSQIVESNDELRIQVNQITFDESIKNCLNSIQIILSHPDYVYTHPIYILSYSNGMIDFSNVYKKNLGQIQIEIYGIIINFLSYTNVFNSGERLLMDNVGNVTSFSKALLMFSIGIIFLLNFLLFILCLYGFKLAQSLLVLICKDIIRLLSNKDVKSFFESRIDNLLIVNRLYAKNPNTIITALLKAENHQLKKNKHLRSSVSNITPISQLPNQFKKKNLRSTMAKCLKLVPCTSNKDEERSNIFPIKQLIKPYRKLTKIIFALFFIIDLLFAWFVFNNFINVVNLSRYVQLNYIFENSIYTNIGITQIMGLLLMTNDDVAYDLGYNVQELNDSILNINNRDTFAYFDMLNTVEINNNKTYPHLSFLFKNSSDCLSFTTQINDSVVNSISLDQGINYTSIVVDICNKMNALSLPDFAFIYNDIMLKIRSLQVFRKQNSYNESENFNNSYQLFDLYTLALVILRPLRNYIKKTLLAERIDNQLRMFIVLMAIFLAVNIIMTGTIFLLIKCFIFRRLELTDQSFNSLKRCFLMQHL